MERNLLCLQIHLLVLKYEIQPGAYRCNTQRWVKPSTTCSHIVRVINLPPPAYSLRLYNLDDTLDKVPRLTGQTNLALPSHSTHKHIQGLISTSTKSNSSRLLFHFRVLYKSQRTLIGQSRSLSRDVLVLT